MILLVERKRRFEFYPFNPRHGADAHRHARQTYKGERRVENQCLVVTLSGGYDPPHHRHEDRGMEIQLTDTHHIRRDSMARDLYPLSGGDKVVPMDQDNKRFGMSRF